MMNIMINLVCVNLEQYHNATWWHHNAPLLVMWVINYIYNINIIINLNNDLKSNNISVKFHPQNYKIIIIYITCFWPMQLSTYILIL